MNHKTLGSVFADVARREREAADEIAAQRAAAIPAGLNLYALDNVVYAFKDGTPLTTTNSHSEAVAVVLAYGRSGRAFV